MLQQKIEEAFLNKNISKITLEDNKAVYGVFTGKINVINNISSSGTEYKCRYYFKEIDMDEYHSRRDVYKAMKTVIVIMQDQISDIEETIYTGFSEGKEIMRKEYGT